MCVQQGTLAAVGPALPLEKNLVVSHGPVCVPNTNEGVSNTDVGVSNTDGGVSNTDGCVSNTDVCVCPTLTG